MQLTLKDVVRFCDGVYTGTEEKWEVLAGRPFSGVSIDSRTVRPGDLFVPFVGTRHDGHDFVLEALQRGAYASLWQDDHGAPPIDQPIVVVQHTLQALQTLALMVRNLKGVQVVAVTGSNGKTTTRTLIASVLAQRFRTYQSIGNYNNELGLPLSILNMPDDTEVLVLEMGMNHEGEISVLSKLARPDLAVITNIGEAHIGYLGSREAIARAKSEIVVGMGQGGTLYLPYGEVYGEHLLRKSPYIRAFSGHVVSVGLIGDIGDTHAHALSLKSHDGPSDDGPDVWGRLLADEGLLGTTWAAGFRAQKERIDTFALKLFGTFYGHNALYAYAIGRFYGLSGEAIARGLKSVSPPQGRMHVRTSPQGALVIDDTYNANPSSLRAALQALVRLEGYEKVLVLGDFGELGQHEQALYESLAHMSEWNDVHVFLYGERVAALATLLKTLARPKTLHLFDSEEALMAHITPLDRPHVALLFKASRAARFDRFVAQLLGG